MIVDIEFDSVIQVHADGSTTERHDIFAPECYFDGNMGIDFAGDTRWEAITGYSGQDRYSGPIMHESEIFAGPMAESVLASPGIYTLVVVTDLDDEEHPAGWAALKMKETA